MKIANITLTEYALIKDKSMYDFVINFSVEFSLAHDHFEIGDLTHKSFGAVKELQHRIEKGADYEGILESIKELTGINDETLLNKSLLSFHQTMHYIISEVDRINQLEAKTLSYEPTEIEISAGIEKFNVLGHFNQIAHLAEKFNWTLDYVRSIKYSDAFALLYRDKISSEYQKKYTKLINRKKT